MDVMVGEAETSILPLYIALLANITRHEKGALKLLTTEVTSMKGYYVHKMIPFLTKPIEDEAKDRHGWILTIFNNITQVEEGRKIVLENKTILDSIIDNIKHSNVIRRRGALGTIANCLFDSDYHEKLLSDEQMDLISKLVAPIKGPGDYDDDDCDGMPEALKEIPPTKKIEVDAESRANIINSLILLTATRFGRDYMKAKKMYPIVRELDKVEKNENISSQIYELVHVLLLDDPEDNPEPEEIEEPPKVEKKVPDLDECGEEIEEL